ncbi:uncharacterized protein LOC124292610 [Neodiprion lecontei]|uniref:Uncharacterized protein LOC124292610 n=1 Tax=Neodiprion lecontei TaxID=441921 RepID=A0ABM3FCG2_NEOLC|nr:uncharacterized protein LOC124292610 [Neodiprion lecontei]
MLFLVQLDFQDKHSVTSALQVRYLDFQDMRSVGYNPRWLSVVFGGGWRWLGVVMGDQCGRGGGQGRQGERGSLHDITRGGYRWLLEVVGGGWRWSKVDEEEDEEDQEHKVNEKDEDLYTVNTTF